MYLSYLAKIYFKVFSELPTYLPLDNFLQTILSHASENMPTASCGLKSEESGKCNLEKPHYLYG